MARRRTKSVKKVDLREAYIMGGYTGEYSWFVRTKVTPIIGEASLHPMPSKAGSRVKEYSVTPRNLHRVVKALGIENVRYKQVRAVRKAVVKAGPDATAKMIMSLVEKTEQPTSTAEFPVCFRIPLHPISENKLYTKSARRVHKTRMYTQWSSHFSHLIDSIVDDPNIPVDLSKPLALELHIGHKEMSSPGHYFDLQNLDKAAIDCAFEYFGSADNKVRDLHVTGEFVEEYSDGFIEYRLRNL